MNVLLVQHSMSDARAYPLGLGYVASVLKDAGHAVHFLDLALEGGDPERRLLLEVRSVQADAIGMTLMTPNYEEARTLVSRVRPELSGIPIVVGGPHPCAVPEETLKDGTADIVVLSEGETMAKDLFSAIEEGGDLQAVPGIAYLDGDARLVVTSPPHQVSDLDASPYPAWDIISPGRYPGTLRGRKMAVVLTTRGCPFRCVNCYRGPAAGRHYRKRSISNIMEELRRLYREYGIRAFGFRDDIFTLDMDRARGLCDAISAEGLDIIWNCQTRVDRVDRDLLQRMKRSGCISVDFGVESGSEEILKNLKKRITKEQARQAVRNCREIGLPTRAFFMIGLPWETPDTVEETIAFAKELRATNSYFFLATPYPGTVLRDQFLEAGLPVATDYSEYRQSVVTKNSEANGRPDEDDDRRAFYVAQCHRAAAEVVLNQVRDLRHYPEYIRAYLRLYSMGELLESVPRRLRSSLSRDRNRVQG
jgi:radical SAM superfamily enzyme YgiQ (UPF0313 family)